MNKTVIPLTFTALFSMLFLLGAAGAVASEGGAAFALSLVVGLVGSVLSATAAALTAPLKKA